MAAMGNEVGKENKRITEISNWLYETAKPIRILSHVSWSPEIRERFLAGECKELPQNVVYPDLPALAELYSRGLCQKPKFLPNWAKDPRFLISYLGYSSFLNSVDLQKVQRHFKELIASLPE